MTTPHRPTQPPTLSASDLADSLTTYREAGPLVQCLTNTVVTNWTANVLLASGGSPAMVDNPDEAGVFARVASAVLINMGTPQTATVAAMHAAVEACAAAGTPWVLDPVAAGGLPWRTEIARTLVAEHAPAIIRGNASEIAGLAGGSGGRGVDSTDSPEAVLDIARALATEHGCVVAVSGPVDHLTDGDRLVRLANGHALMTQVTGVGCSLGALMAGFAGSVDDPLLAAAGATALLTIAAERAAESASGPGSFAVALLDQLAAVTPEDVDASARVS